MIKKIRADTLSDISMQIDVAYAVQKNMCFHKEGEILMGYGIINGKRGNQK